MKVNDGDKMVGLILTSDLRKLHELRIRLHNAQNVKFDELRDIAETMRLLLERVDEVDLEFVESTNASNQD